MLRARFVVARYLGMSYGQVAAMDRWELAHWIAMTRIDPPVNDAMNMMMARLCSVVANCAFGSKGGYRADRFMFDFEAMATKVKRSATSTKAAFMAWAIRAAKGK